jgi:hypothetical protein
VLIAREREQDSMKLSFISVIALTLLTAAPAFAQQGHDQNHMQQHSAPQHSAPQHRASYREGQNYHGHKLHNQNGHWGYYQPRNGSQVFISIPL